MSKSSFAILVDLLEKLSKVVGLVNQSLLLSLESVHSVLDFLELFELLGSEPKMDLDRIAELMVS